MTLRYLTSPLLVLSFAALFAPLPCRADIETIPAGNDYLVTLPGTFTTIAGVGIVPLMGIPSFAYGADTVIQRTADVTLPDAIGGTAMVSAHLAGLTLESAAPVNIGGSFFDIFVTLDPSQSSTGQLTLTQTALEGTPTSPEGTLTSFFDFFVDISAVPVGGGPPAFSTTSEFQLSGSGFWNDPDDGAQFLNGPVQDCEPGSCHDATQVPEPGSVGLLLTAILGCGFGLKRRRSLHAR
jgi:hypothetical protein